jgi:3-ketosteroid 9alpha-monooxygenase subunit B
MALEFYELTVADVIDETADSRSFVLDIPPALRERFTYRAGQFLTFEVPWSDFTIRRCYSLSSSPDVDAAPRITVKRVEGGRASNWILDHVEAGGTLRTSPADGRFVLDAAAGERLLTLFGGGSGITPLLSLMKTALVRTKRRIKLIYANRDPDSVILKRELEALAAQHPARVEIHYHYDDARGFLTTADLQQLVRGRADGDHYVCGPKPFMDAVGQALKAAGVPRERTYFEFFVSPLDPDRRAALVRSRAPAAGGVPTVAQPDPKPTQPEAKPVPSSFVLRLEGKAHTVPYEPGLTLLAAAQRSGVGAPSSCEDGYCGTCVAHRLRGSVEMRSTEALSPAEIERGMILLCQSMPTSAEPLEVDCDALPSRSPTPPAPAPSPSVLPRLLASIFVLLVFTLFFLSRSQP